MTRTRAESLALACEAVEQLPFRESPLGKLVTLRVGHIASDVKIPEPPPAPPTGVEVVLVANDIDGGELVEVRTMRGKEIAARVQMPLELLDDALRALATTRAAVVVKYGPGSTRPATLKAWGTSTSARPRKVRCR